MNSNVMDQAAARVTTLAAKVCPKAPPGAAQPVQDIQGYVLWGVGILFFLGIIVGIGGVVGGRVFAMPHASKVSMIGIVVVFVAVIGYLVLPGVLTAMMGQGCI
ncbi:hypothetical protein [Segeticoccus rhizosphaerae]|uniref:hypothetical protein n=1 Tax=Segeticoccus rhizosphaerae TaxID=1104777 RepID=UPI001EF0CBF7|nr:hypothetical protein [Segeticoccus rhizosphaerae]